MWISVFVLDLAVDTFYILKLNVDIMESRPYLVLFQDPNICGLQVNDHTLSGHMGLKSWQLHFIFFPLFSLKIAGPQSEFNTVLKITKISLGRTLTSKVFITQKWHNICNLLSIYYMYLASCFHLNPTLFQALAFHLFPQY